MITTAISDQKILTVAKSLPVAPQIMARLHTMLLDTNSGLTDIANLLKRDVALTTRIIRIANSPAYNGGGIGTIEEALQRVGFGEVFRLVGVVANATLAEANLRSYGYSAVAFRANNLCTALVAEGIAHRIGTDPRLAYTCGLLRGIGHILLDHIARESLPANESFPESGGGLLVDWERRAFGTTHFDVARLVLSEWGFPELVVKTVSHDNTQAEPPTPLAHTLHLADSIARLAGHGLEGEDTVWGITHEDLEATGLTTNDTEIIRAEALASLRTLQNA